MLRRSSRCRSSVLLARMKASSTSYCRTSPAVTVRPACIQSTSSPRSAASCSGVCAAMARPSVACPSLISTNRAMSARPSSTSVRTSVCLRPVTVVSRSSAAPIDREQALALPLADAAVDVQAAAHVAADVPLRGRPAVEHPPVVAVRRAQPVLDLERPAVRGGAHAAVVRPVGRVDPVLPGQAQVGVGLGAGELQPAAVDEQPLARPARPPR